MYWTYVIVNRPACILKIVQESGPRPELGPTGAIGAVGLESSGGAWMTYLLEMGLSSPDKLGHRGVSWRGSIGVYVRPP